MAADGAGNTSQTNYDDTDFYKLTGNRVVIKERGKLRAEDGPLRIAHEELGPGVITIHWDNEHSYFRSKNIEYQYSLNFPETSDDAVPELPAASQSANTATAATK